MLSLQIVVCHEPLAWEFGQPLPAFAIQNKVLSPSFLRIIHEYKHTPVQDVTKYI